MEIEHTHSLLKRLDIDYVQDFSVPISEPLNVILESHAEAWHDR